MRSPIGWELIAQLSSPQRMAKSSAPIICAPTSPGGGSHVANCGYMTAASATGRGIARRMCEHSLHHAKERGFKAMQFNFVVSSNERAVRLWQSFGFETVGRLPLAFLHPREGYTDALVMFRTL
jgi:ribosomal protein S18 acetylase RimI-like enzyme